MRYVGIVLVLLSLPVFIAVLQSDRNIRRYAYFAIGLLPFVMSIFNVDASLYVLSGVRGHNRGMVVTLLDTLALAILFTSPKPFARLTLSWAIGGYILAALLSVAQAPSFMISFGYVFQLMRMFVVFAAVAAILREPGAMRFLAAGLAVGAIIQGGWSMYQRATGVFQASGTMGHQNLLGMMLHFVTLPLLAMLMAGNRSKLLMWGVAAGLGAVAVGASRGTIGFLGLGIGLLFALSLLRGATPRKFKILGIGMAMIAVLSPIVVSGLQERLEGINANKSGYDERAAFEKAASMMFADYPMGVGANRYTFVAITEGYSEAAGVGWAKGSRAAVVHNLYWLTAAELGYFGVLAIALLFVVVVYRGLRFAFAHRRDPRGDVVLGATVAVLATALHSFYEWVFVLMSTQYVVVISLGIIAGTIRQHAEEQTAMRRRARSAENADVTDMPRNTVAGGSRRPVSRPSLARDTSQ